MRAALLVVLAGCLEPSLVDCPDGIVCPAGSVCGPSGGCFSPDELAACEGIADDEPCTGGYCVAGVCVPSGCGNRARTPDEVCDDGNTINGDGCSADCRSDETCGNGTTDFAAGEQCDDGNDAPGDACEPGCMLPRCGDGYVDGIEECDPAATLATTRTCEDFGYYGGSLSCNDICRLDPTMGCTGRCGDSIVQADREDCDTAPPAATCIDFGYDVGALTCSFACAADPVRSCDRYGWEELGSAGAPIRIRADGDIVITQSPVAGPMTIFENGTATTLSGGFVATDVRAGAIVRATQGVVELRAAASTTFDPLPSPGLTGMQEIVDIVFADDGTPVILVSNSLECEVKVLIGAVWITTPVMDGCVRLLARSATNFIVRSDSAVEWHFPGGTRTQSAPGVKQIDYLNDTTINIHTYSSNAISRIGLPTIGPGASGVILDDVSYRDIVIVGNAIYGVTNSIFNAYLVRHWGGRIDDLPFASSTTGAPSVLALGRDGQIYAGSDSRAYRFQHVAKIGRNLPSPSDFSHVASLATAADGTLVYCAHQLFRSTDYMWEQLTTTGSPACTKLFARSANEIYAQRGPAGSTLSRFTGASATTQMLNGSALSVEQLTGDATILLATTTTSIVTKVGAGAWIELPSLPAGCTGSPVLAAKGGVAYVGTTCSGNATVLRFDGNSWVTVLEQAGVGSPTSMIVLADDTVWMATALLVVLHGKEGGSWTRLDNGGIKLVAAGDRIFATTHNRLHEWTGTRWSVIRTLPNLNLYHLVATPRDVIVAGAVLADPTIRFLAYAIPP